MHPFYLRFDMLYMMTLFELNSLTSPWTVMLAGVVFVGILLTISNDTPFARVGKSWPRSLMSGRNAMTFTMEKHVQDGYTTVNRTQLLCASVKLFLLNQTRLRSALASHSS